MLQTPTDFGGGRKRAEAWGFVCSRTCRCQISRTLWIVVCNPCVARLIESQYVSSRVDCTPSIRTDLTAFDVQNSPAKTVMTYHSASTRERVAVRPGHPSLIPPLLPMMSSVYKYVCQTRMSPRKPLCRESIINCLTHITSSVARHVASRLSSLPASG